MVSVVRQRAVGIRPGGADGMPLREHQRRADPRRGPAHPPHPVTLTVGGLWRYPVKSLAGEALRAARLTTGGIPGDRIVHVRGPEGVRTSRRQYRMLGLHAALGADGRPKI